MVFQAGKIVGLDIYRQILSTANNRAKHMCTHHWGFTSVPYQQRSQNVSGGFVWFIHIQVSSDECPSAVRRTQIAECYGHAESGKLWLKPFR